MADIQISATGGDVTEQTSIQTGRGLTATDSLPVQDGVEQFSSHEKEEMTETEVLREGQPIVPSSMTARILLCIFQERDTGF